MYYQLCVAAIAAAASSCAFAQTPAYTFEMRLVPDGTANAPAGPWTMHPLPANYNGGFAMVGFWLQARVSQVGGENWGVVRAIGSISVADTVSAATLTPGTVNASGTQTGRGSGYRNGLPNNVGGFDAFVGATRSDNDFDGDGSSDDNGDGVPENPWGVNGALHAANVDGVPILGNGTFSPWANLYRVWLNTGVQPASGFITLSAQATLVGSLAAAPTDATFETWAMQQGPSQTLTASYTINWPIPTPGAAAVLGLGGPAVLRRRR
jgi:hypothetical protein